MSADDRPWWPSTFGAEDQHGMLNQVTDAKRRDALALVRHGRMYDLGRVLDHSVPVFPGNAIRVGDHLADRLGVSLAPAIPKQAAGERARSGVSR